MIAARLAEAPASRVSADAVLEELATLLSYDQPTKLFETLITWGRYAEIFDYDQQTNVIFPQAQDQAADHDGEAT